MNFLRCIAWSRGIVIMREVAMEFALDRRGVGLRLMTPVSFSLQMCEGSILVLG